MTDLGRRYIQGHEEQPPTVVYDGSWLAPVMVLVTRYCVSRIDARDPAEPYAGLASEYKILAFHARGGHHTKKGAA